MLSTEMDFSWKCIKNLLCFPGSENAKQLRQRIEETIDDALLERNDGIVGDGDAFGTNLGTTRCDIAQADAEVRSQILQSVAHVQGVHFEGRHMNQKSWTNELFLHVMLTQDVADVLAKIALDALAEFLHSFDILLGDAPRSIRSVGRPRLEPRDAPLHRVVPRDVGDQVFYVGKRLHRFDGDRLVERQRVQPGHAHQFRHPVYFGRTGPASSRLAVPAHSEIAGLFRLNLMNDIEHDHAGRNFGAVIAILSLAFLSAPDAKRGRRHYFISSMICRSSSGKGGSGSRENCIAPSAPLRTTMLKAPNWLFLSGKSSRKWAPRLSFRSRAARVTISETVSRWYRSSAVCQPALYSRFPSTLTRSLAIFNSRMRSTACSISSSCRTMPTRSCITSCNVCCIAYGFSEFLRSNGCSAHVSADLSSPLSTLPRECPLAKVAAYSPARWPKTSRSEREFPPSLLAPCNPAAHSPAANNPGTSDIWESASTRTPPIM